jgi:hypothetical protein
MSRPKFDHKVIRPNGYWVPSNQTDVAKTFKKVQERLKKPEPKKVIAIRRTA